MLSIRRKFNISILVVAIFSSILIGLVSILQGRKIVEKEAKKVLLQTAKTYANQFEIELNKLKQYQESLEAFIRSTEISNDENTLTRNKSHIYNYIRYYCKNFKPFSLWVVFNPDYYNFPLVASMYDSTGNGNYIFEPNYDIRSLSQTGDETKWWRDAIEKGEVWTAPYYWKPWDKNIISYSKALFQNSKPIAVMGSDFNFNNLKKQLSEVQIYESGYIWMMDSSLNIFSHPSYEGKNLIDIDSTREIFNALKGSYSKEGNIEYQFIGLHKILAYKQLSNGWFICVSAPYKEIFKGSTLIFRYIALIILLTIVASVFLSNKIAKAITNPLNKFVETFVKGATGDLTIRVPETSKDELRLLEFHFNHFLEKTQRMVDELNQTQRSLLKANNEAIQANKLKSVFLANMSHEIRTPLNSIIGFTSLLRMKGVAEEERKKYIELVIQSSYSLLTIVESLIEFSSIEVGMIEVRPTLIKVDDFIKSFMIDFTTNYRNQIPEGLKIHYQKDYEVKDLEMFSDSQKIKRILYHLLDNAIKYTPSGEIVIGYHSDDLKELVFFIKDTGIGIKKDNQEFVWESFYKGDTSDSKFYNGAGLGLSICQKLTKLLNGKIWFESEYGKGSSFFLSLPLESPPGNLSEIANTFRYPEVLIVDSSIDSFRKINENVSKYDIKSIWARNGVEALGLITMEPTVKLVICNLFSSKIEGILSLQLLTNINSGIKALVFGNASAITELKRDYNVDVDFFSENIIDDHLYKDILTPIMQKEQL